jgi:arginase
MDRALSVAALRCRTSDRTAGGARGAESLALALDPNARLVGTPGEPRTAPYDEDLRDSHGCLLEAGGQLDDMLSAGRFPVLTASDCSICMTTFQAVIRHAPDAHVLWLDAHGDFNTP